MQARYRVPSLWVLIPISSLLLLFEPFLAIAGFCELSVQRSNAIYNYSLASPTPKYPHGVQSEDGFYKITVNGTLLWFQLCDQMIFNHDPPNCLGCQDCGGPSRCGMKCSALVANNDRGYYICQTVGYASSLDISLIDENYPQKGVVVNMSAIHGEHKCSLSVSVLCDSKEAQVPNSLQLLGSCAYATEFKHPSGCPKVISANGGGWGWFSILIIILLCLLGAYLLIGAIYRFYFLGIRGAEVIPNLEFWKSLFQIIRPLLRRLRRIMRIGHFMHVVF